MSNAALFPSIVATVLDHEGGYVNDPKDPGGETKYGISKRAFPREDIKNLSRERAITLYLKHYWVPARCGELPAHLQPIHFDTAVNCGVVQAIRLLQLAADVEPDGVFGARTLAAAQRVTVQRYAQERLAYNERIITANPKLARFRRGWARRINSYVKLLVGVLLLTGCGLFRPSAEQQCRKAQGLQARAALICPEAVQLRTDTLRTTLPGDSSAGAGPWTQAQVDSVLAACAQLSEALSAERELYRVSNSVAARVVGRQARALDSLRRAMAAAAPVQRLRRTVCTFPSVLDSTSERRLRIWWTADGPRYDLVVYPRTVEQVATHPTLVQGPVITTGGAPWWHVPLMVLLALVAGFFYLQSDHFRFHLRRLGGTPKGMAVLLGMAAASATGAQTLLETDVQRMKGERQLHLQGLFTDADTVLMQVYHDSDVLSEEVCVHTWSLVLGSFEGYIIKFTDGQRREKRLYVVELSDDQLEFCPPIEVDFSVAGNLVMVKERDRQPNFQLYNAGTSRKR